MSVLSENIKFYRKQNGLTQKELAKILGVAPTAVSAWELGRNKPLMDNVEQMSETFNIKKSVLLGDTLSELSPATPPSPQSGTIQVSDEVAYLDKELKEPHHGKWVDYGEKLLIKQRTQTSEIRGERAEYNSDKIITLPQMHDYDFYDSATSAGTGQYLGEVQKETISLPVNVDADFVIPVYGHSMEPEYYTGDHVFVKLSVDLKDGDVGVFDYYGDAYIKQLIIAEDGAYLRSFNPEYKDIPIDADSDFRIIGEVVGVYREE